jgi:rhodanese-related sulfurtransferase
MTDIPFEERVREAKQRIQEITAAEAIQRRWSSTVVLVDVREQNEWNLFRIPGAVHVPLAVIAQRAESIPRDGEVVIYCGSGNRSALAADTLREMGYLNVSSLAGGIRGWANAGGELED